MWDQFGEPTSMSKDHIDILASHGVEVKHILGSGFNGTVYAGTFSKELPETKAKPSKLRFIAKLFNHRKPVNRKCAIKYMVYNDGDDIQIKQELDTLQSLTHDNIVEIRSVFYLDQHTVAIVMELAEFGSVETFLKSIRDGEQEKLTVKQFEKLADGLIKGLKALHQTRRAHRDIDAGNVLLFDSKKGVVGKLSDFGMTKVYENNEKEGVAMEREQEKDLVRLKKMLELIAERAVDGDSRQLMETVKGMV